MLHFLQKNFREAGVLLYDDELTSISAPATRLAYDSSPQAIGFDIKGDCQYPELHYLLTILRWAATKVGDLEPDGRGGVRSYIVHDGSERWPVDRVVKPIKDPSDLGPGGSLAFRAACLFLRLLMTLWGVRRQMRRWDVQIEAEVSRLEGLWAAAAL